MSLEQNKDLDCYEEGRKKMGFAKELELYEYTKEKAEKSSVLSELKVWVVMKKEDKR